MARILNGMRANWSVAGEKMGPILKSGRPDVVVTSPGARCVLLENEFMPATTLEKIDVLPKLGREFHAGGVVEAIIAVRTPTRFKDFDDEVLDAELRSASDLDYAVHADGRFPEEGWLTGSLAEIATAIEVASVPRRTVDECVDMMAEGTDCVASMLKGAGGSTRKKIAKLLSQKENEQTWRMAGLILSNAFVFHSHIAGEREIKTLAELTQFGSIPTQSLVDEWDRILVINYYPIFSVARKIISSISDSIAQKIIAVLTQTTGRINAMGLAHSTDMYGSLIQKMINDRKTLASFYTLPESAALLASMVVPPPGSGIYENPESLQRIRVADFACGTGTLLTTIYRRLFANYEAAGNDMEAIHAKMMENCIIGFDILPSATHLTVSALAEIFPKKLFSNSKIGRIFFGKKNGKCHMGSLGFIEDSTTFDEQGVYIVSDSERPYEHPEVSNNAMDVVCMNPPFTSHTREGGKERLAMFKSFDMDDRTQNEMSAKSKKMFAGTCADGNAGYATNFIAIADKKLAPGGALGLVLPATISDGASYQKCRDLLRLKYQSLTVISIAGENTADGAFSYDTDMNEVIVVAKKHEKGTLKKIQNVQTRLKDIDKNIAKLQRSKKAPAAALRAEEAKRAEIQGKLRPFEIERATFVNIEQRPPSVLQSFEISNYVRKCTKPAKLDGDSYAASPITLGKKTVGGVLDCPLDSVWWFVNVRDVWLSQCAYMLRSGTLKISEWEYYDVPMTVLGDNFGPLTRDIADKKPKDKRAPFVIEELNSSAVYYSLSRNDSSVQQSLLVEPDGRAEPKPDADPDRVKATARTATHIHMNILARYTSQALLVPYTTKKTLGGGALPSFNTKHEKALAVWGNSSLGVLCFWAHSGKQQFGRGISSQTAMAHMPVLDFGRLGAAKIKKLDKIFDKYAAKKLRPLKYLYDDPVRIAMDGEVCGLLGIKGSLDDMRRRLCREPSVSGGTLSPGL